MADQDDLFRIAAKQLDMVVDPLKRDQLVLEGDVQVELGWGPDRDVERLRFLHGFGWRGGQTESAQAVAGEVMCRVIVSDTSRIRAELG